MNTVVTKNSNLREMLKKEILTLPGVFNGLSALEAKKAGFGACYIGGSTVCAMSGQPDIGIVGLDGFCHVIKEVSSATGLPILVDADTGFGEEEMMTKTTIEYYRSGAAGLHIEDQVFPKRCGHLEGKSLIETDLMLNKIQRAVNVRNQIQDQNDDFIVCARTDARSVSGLDEAIERAIAYAKADVDMVFPEGLNNKEEFRIFAKAMEPYRKKDENGKNGLFLLANMTEFGTTDVIPVQEYEELGYDTVIFPASSMRAAMGGVSRLFANIYETGHVKGSLNEMQTREEMYDLMKYNPGEEWFMPSH